MSGLFHNDDVDIDIANDNSDNHNNNSDSDNAFDFHPSLRNADDSGGGAAIGFYYNPDEDDTPNHNADDYDDVREEDIRKMAAALAPQMSELEDVLRDISATDDDMSNALELAETATKSLQMEDDDMDDELQQLAMSEQALREELEFAHDVNSLLSSNKDNDDEDDHFDYSFLSVATSSAQMTPMMATPSKEMSPRPGSGSGSGLEPMEMQPVVATTPSYKPPPANYSLQDHADYLKISTEKMGGWYYCDMTSFLLPENATTTTTNTASLAIPDLVKDYCLPIPFRKLKRLYSGLMYHQVVSAKTAKELATPAKLLASPAPTRMSSSSSSSNHPMTPAAVRTPSTTVTPVRPSTSTKNAATTPRTPAPSTPPPPPPPPPKVQEEPLPVRTVAIRIRPDVLCGAVMDACHHAFELLPTNSCTWHVLKRQGGHLRGGVYLNNDHSKTATTKSLAFVIDAQLCTQKNDELERRLLLRFYHVQDDPEAMQELGQALHQKKQKEQHDQRASTATGETESATTNTRDTFHPIDEPENDSMAANRHMKQACSLIQRLMAAQQQAGGERLKQMEIKHQHNWLGVRDITKFKTEQEMQSTVAFHLESNFKACSSVREENKKPSPTIRRLTLPALSEKDWSLLEASWKLTSSIMDELDTRDCTYNTIATLPFGQFPSLPTLDVHYCSQLRRLSRESMINHLLKAAKDLEDYSKGAEYNCAICITLLEPMLKRYNIPPLDLPKTSKSLQEYPLEFTPPQVACPPWGTMVMEALNQVAAKSPTGEIDALSAVRMVYDAFMKQDDEEQAARLGRKNSQIMDRLALLQKHQRALVQNLRDAHVYSEVAAQEASAFLNNAQKAINAGRPGYPETLQPEVPILSFRMSQGASTSGTCYVSSTQLLFVTKYIPLVSSHRSAVYNLDQVHFQVDESVAATLLNPFPNTMNVVLARTNELLISFRPTIGPTRLNKFLKVIQSFANEERPSEFGEVVETFDDDNVDHEEDIRITDTNSEGQLSV